MGEVEFESFEITDQDLEDEFNPDRRRPHLTKQQQIYGIWADDERESRPSVSKASYSHKNYSGISFVGGGVQQAGKKNEKDENEGSDDDDADGESPDRSSNSSDEGYTPKSLPIHFGKRNIKGGLRFSGMSGFAANETGDEFGGWEKYTKGIGHTLLLQMGYQPGKGLGRDLQGIVNPIEAKQRKGRGALGLYGSEHVKPRVTLPESDEEDEQQLLSRKNQWKKKTEEGKKKVKYTFKTVEDVIAEGGSKRMFGDSSQLSKVKVIDLTGPEQRVLSGYHAIHQQHSKPTEQDDDKTTKRYHHFALPELTHNLDLLLDLTEQEIIQNDRQLRHEKDLIINIQHEIEKLDKVMENEKNQIQSTQEILSIIDELENKSHCVSLTLQEAAAMFRKLQDDYYEDYKLLELANLAVTFVFPLVVKHFENWNPLRESKFGVEVMKEWKDILEMNLKQYSSKDMDVYHRLVWDVWMPHVRQAVLEWNCRDCVPLIELLENWLPVIPPWVTENILTQLIFPRLQQEVENWNPLMDRMYIHVWIHPWLPLMGPRLETLYAPIRNKLANAMVNWHPSDDSARKILQPWIQVFPRGAMESFVLKNILPKLILCMQEFIINPHQQHLEPWHWVMAWEDYLPLPSLVNLLEKTFFPKWFHVLCSWLSHNPNYDEVSQWYTGWKSMFPDALLSHPAIKDQFNNALEIMNRAVSLGYQPGMRDHVSYLSSLERQRETETSQMQNARNFEGIAQGIRTGGSSASNITLTFKDLISRKAEEMGILFMPIPNRFQEAKQVYRFGQLLMYIDRGVIFVQNAMNGNSWVPTSLQTLVEMAR